MLPEFLRRLLRKHESAKVQDEPAQPGGETSFFVRELAAGNTEALGELVIRFDKVMIATARHLTRRYHVRGAFFEAEDVLSDTLLRLLAEASEGRLDSIKNTTDFWRRFYYSLRAELRALEQETHAVKRGGQGRSPAHANGNAAAPEHCRRLDSEILARLVDKTPGPDDLALATIQVEFILRHLNGTLVKRVVAMRQEDYTTQEIAQEIGVTTRTIERCMRDVRELYLQRNWSLSWVPGALEQAGEAKATATC